MYIDAERLEDSMLAYYECLEESANGRPYKGDTLMDYEVVDMIEDCIDNAPTANVVEIPKSDIGNLSDGYHTFNELYHHRAVLFSVICNSMPDKAWKSKLHDTGDMYEGMFIVGIETPDGQATYHYDIEYWDMFKVRELEKAPKWDGHTPTDAINRIAKLSADVVEVKHGRWIDKPCIKKFNNTNIPVVECTKCGISFCDIINNHRYMYRYCPNCGAKMDGVRSDT